MLKIIFIYFVLTLTAYAQFARTFEIGQLHPESQRIEGIEFPRMKELKYRGVGQPQYDASKAIKAMLGFDEHIESMLFSGIKLLLMKEKCPFCSSLENALSRRGFRREIEAALQNNQGKPFKEAEAKKVAFALIEDELAQSLRSGKFIDEKVDYRSSRYELFPSDLVFSTIHLEVANIYSKSIAVLKGGQKDYLDLNYWNKIHNGAFLFINRKWADRGEFITPILVESSDVTGFLEYLTQAPDYTVFRPLPNELDYAYMQVGSEGAEKLVLVFDGIANGSRSTAIMEHEKGFVLAKSTFDPQSDFPDLISPVTEKPSLIGIFKLCPVAKPCALKTPLFKQYKRSRRALPPAVITAVTSSQMKNLVPKLFFMEGTLKSDQLTSAPFVPVAQASKDLMLEKLQEEKLPSAEVIDTPAIETKRKLTWNLGDKPLHPGSALYFPVPESFRLWRPKKLTLTHRQDSEDNSTQNKGKFDKSPAYTGIELFALSDSTEEKWRYIPNPSRFSPPKDSFFADIQTAKEARPITVDIKTVTKGHHSEKEIHEELIVGGLRLLGLGTDPSRIIKLELEFEE